VHFPVLIRMLTAVISTVFAGMLYGNDWPSYGADAASSKYAPFDQIAPGTIGQLQLSWTWMSPDNETVLENQRQQNFRATPGAFKVTPIAVKGVLYTSTSFGRVVAIDGATGEQLWSFDTRSWEAGRPANLGYNHRGVSYWSDGIESRIFMPSNDSWLWSLDAATGVPDPGFGIQGRVDLTQGLGRPVDRSAYTQISAPMIVGDIVVVGSSINDVPRQKEAPPGHVRGFDVRTGGQVWIFHTIPQAGVVWCGNMGGELLAIYRQHQRVDLDERGRRAWLSLSASRDADE